MNSGVIAPPEPSLPGAGTSREVSTEGFKAVANNPVFKLLEKVTNPDGITLTDTIPIPLWNPGVSVTITKNFDIFVSKDFGIDWGSTSNALQNAHDPSKFSQKAREGLKGGVSLNLNYILENNISPNSRKDFFTGQSATTGGCLIICVGTTRTGTRQEPRTSLNVGLSGGGGAAVTFNNGIFLGNPNRWFFGPTPLNGGER